MAELLIRANGEYDLGGGDLKEGSVVFQLTGTWTGNITPKLRVAGRPQSDSANVVYRNLLAGGADIAAGTALTGNGQVAVKAGGAVVSLNVASLSSAAGVTVTYHIVAGGPQ